MALRPGETLVGDYFPTVMAGGKMMDSGTLVK